MDIIKVLLPLLIEFAPMIIECIDKPDDQESRGKLRKFAERWAKLSFESNNSTEFAVASGLVCMSHQPEEQFQASLKRLNGTIEMGQKLIDETQPITPIEPQ